MLRAGRSRRLFGGGSVLSWRGPIAGFAAAAGLGVFAVVPAAAQSLPFPASAFQTYNPAAASSIVPGPFALYTVPVDEIQPGQLNVGFSEIERKIYGWDILTPSQLQATLLTDVEPVVIGPGGILVLENGHHTFTSLEDSAYGASDPDVYINVVANFSNMSVAQFWATMQADDLLLPLNDGVPEVVSATGAPIPTSLQGLTNDNYRGLEESILKNKSSKLFTSSANITGEVGSSIPGLDKLTGDFSDFLWADAYRNANGGLGLPYLSPGDIALATNWNLNPNSTTTLPNIGTVTVGQLPGFILNQDITISSTISNATLSTGALAANGTFTGITEFNLGTPSNPIIVGTPQSGFVMQLGYDSGNSVTLSGNNTYTGGTTIIAGNLIVAGGAGGAPSDAALGAAAPANYTINPNSILASVEAANGIVFNSELEGMGTLQFGSTSGNGTNSAANSFSTNRPIAVDGETATINPNGYFVTLNGTIVSLGTFGDGIGNESSISALTINDTSSKANGAVILPASANNSGFYGNWIISAGTLNVSSDASLGNTTGPSYEIGQIDLDGGTLQAGASFSSVRSLFLTGSSTYDTNGFTTSWSGTLTDVQRTLTIENSNASGTGAVGNVTFGSLAAGSTATIAIDAGTGSAGGDGTTVTFTDGITRNGNTDLNASANATVFIDPASGSNLGVSGTNGVEVFSSGASTTLTNGIVPVWIITDSGGKASTNPYNFLTYSSTNGYEVASYTTTFGASNVVAVSSTTTVSNSQAFALNVESGKTLTINSGDTLTIGDGTDPAGLILQDGSTITGGTLAFGASEAVIDVKSTDTISSTVTGTGGLTLSGSGTLVLSGAAGQLTGPINIDSGTLELNTANYFTTANGGTTVWLSNVKSSPSNAILDVNANNVISALDSDGNNSAVNIATGVTLTIGDSNNLNSTLSSTITGTGTGSLVKAGTGLLDISGSGGVSFGTGGTVTVEAGALRIGNGLFSTTATTPITVDAGAELQYSGNSGSVFNDPIEGAGVFHVVGGTVQLTSTSNTYTGGTVLEAGTTLDVTTANLPTGGNIVNAGGILLFDQSTTGTFTGVMSDGQQAGGTNDPNDMACTLVACSTGTLSGTLIKDDSTTGYSGNVTIANQQAYSGMTYIEAGTLTLGAVNTIASSEGVVLGRVGGAVCNPSPCVGATAILALGANNTIAGLADDPANTTQVQLNGFALTLAPIAGSSWSYAGSIIDNGASGSLVQNGPGISILTGTSTYTGATTIDAGILEVDGSITSSSSVTVNSGGVLDGDGTVDPPTVTIVSGGTFAPGSPGVPGTFMTIAGNLAFQTGAFYLVQLNSTSSTYAKVTGTASLAGDVLAQFQSGVSPQKQYTILQSAGLGGTTFAGVMTNLVNFDATLSYTSDDVLLNIGAALGAGVPLNVNQQNVANTLNNFFNNGGTLPANFVNVFGLTGAGLGSALSQLDGEAATGAERSAFQLTTEFLDLMLDPFVNGRGFAPGGSGVGGGGSGGAIGFAPDERENLPPEIEEAYAEVFKAPPANFNQRWSEWGTAYGGANTGQGNAAVGSSSINASTYGVAGGMDYRVSPYTLLGFAMAGGGTGWDLANGLGSGYSQALQVGTYAISWFGPAYLSGALSFTNNWFTTNRAALGDELTANFSGQSYGARLEGGYRVPVWSTLGVTPYGALLAQDFSTPNYSETDKSGGGFGLSYAAMNATDLRTELGARFDDPTLLDGRPLILFSRLAWAHDFVSNPALTAAFEGLPGASFNVFGAPLPHDSAITSAGAQYFLASNWSLIASFTGNFASGYQTYGGTGTLRYTW
jgi:fibronectin-binding autotransporter adhesin